METLNMFTALDRAIERKAPLRAAMMKDTPVKEAYWKIKFKTLLGAMENMLSQLPDDPAIAEAIRLEIGKVIEY